MTPIRRILVPLDGSLTAESVLPHAHRIAATFDSRSLLLHVLEHGRAGGLSRDSVEWRLHRAEAEAYLEDVSDGFRKAGLEVDVDVAEGKAAREIISYAHRWDADLVALSSHGHGGVDDFSLGSIAHKVVSRAGVSILLVRSGPASAEQAPSESRALKEVRYERVIVPVDLSRQSDWALSIAARIARAGGGELQMLHIVSVPQLPECLQADFVHRGYRTRLVDASRELAESYLAEMEEKLSSPGLNVCSCLIESSRVAHSLAEHAAPAGTSLLVLSAHGASGASPWPYGTVAGHLVMHARLPVLVLQDLPRETFFTADAAWSSAAERPAPWSD
jgi:nucleotide-binding universal stress UspA family protein